MKMGKMGIWAMKEDSHNRKGQLYTKYWSNLPTTVMQSEGARLFDTSALVYFTGKQTPKDNCKRVRHAHLLVPWNRGYPIYLYFIVFGIFHELNHPAIELPPTGPSLWKPPVSGGVSARSPGIPEIPTHVASILVLGPWKKELMLNHWPFVQMGTT